MLFCFVCLHIVFAQVVGRAQLVVYYVLYHHILTIELLDNYFAVLRVRVYAADIVVRNPNRIVAVLSIDHKVPRTGLVLICHRFHLRVVKRGNLVDGFLDKLLIVLPSEPVEPSGENEEQQDDENHDEY